MEISITEILNFISDPDATIYLRDDGDSCEIHYVNQILGSSGALFIDGDGFLELLIGDELVDAVFVDVDQRNTIDWAEVTLHIIGCVQRSLDRAAIGSDVVDSLCKKNCLIGFG